MANIIFILLCALYGVASAEANVGLKKWEYWIMLGCVIGAFWCGKFA